MAEKFAEAMRVVEEAREKQQHEGFIADLFLGRVRWDLISPFPIQNHQDYLGVMKKLEEFKRFLWEEIDPNAIDRDGEIADEIIRKLKDMKILSGMKVPAEYGGLQLTQSNFVRFMEPVGSWCGNTAALIAPPNSIGAVIPLLLFGTGEQKNRLLPLFARGAVSAFGLTELDVGSDPSNVRTYAKRVHNKHGEVSVYFLNGHKLYTTGAVKSDTEPLADYIVVVAQIVDDPKELDDPKAKKCFGLFLVSTKDIGFSIAQRCRFMGLKAIYNGLIKFDNVHVYPPNMIGKEGDGLRAALTALTYGRLTIPAICVGASKQALQQARWYAKDRVQWSKPIGEHELTGKRLVDIAARTFVSDALVKYCSMLIDKKRDARLPSAICKVLVTEYLWDSLFDLQQIFAGRGYETADSKRKRGEPGIAVERMVRDARINLIFEGTSEIMRLWIGREGMAEYKERGEKIKPPKDKHSALFVKIGAIGWYASKFIGQFALFLYDDVLLYSHAKFIECEAHKLAFDSVKNCAIYQAGLDKKQIIVADFVNRAMNLFAMSLAISYADLNKNKPLAKELADYFCWSIRKPAHKHNHKVVYKLSKRIMAGEARWLEEGIVSALEKEGVKI